MPQPIDQPRAGVDDAPGTPDGAPHTPGGDGAAPAVDDEGSTERAEAAIPADHEPAVAKDEPLHAMTRDEMAQQLANLKITKWDVLCIGPIIFWSFFAIFTLIFAPQLLAKHTVVVEALRGSWSSIILAGNQASRGQHPLVLVMVAPVLALDFTDPFFYWAGRRYGRAIIDWFAASNPGMRRPLARGERLVAKYGAWMILVGYFLPGAVTTFIYLFAGEVRMRFWLFVLADLTGTLIWVSLLVTLGWHLGDNAQPVADTISSYGWKASIAILVLYVGWTGYKNRKVGRRTA